ncbi:MAG: transcription termination/antitermination protein NusA [Elusimicrobia bacterium]|nr:transcription termination/antitermination protein NusA [Elusimicrobiota bacterium]
MASELLDTLEQIEREKNIKKEDLIQMVEAALLAALRKHLHSSQNLAVTINRETGAIASSQTKKVVEQAKRSDLEISLSEAQKIKPKAKIDDDVIIALDTRVFGRIAAQTAKQIIIQRLLETERENLFNEYKVKEMELINGIVQRVAPKGLIIDLGKIEAHLPQREQIKGESYHGGERIKVIILKVNKTTKGPHVIVSRTHPGLLKRLFELEVPEIYEKIVEIKNVVREPGQRAKIAVASNNEKVDPVGACVGVKGSRIRTIIDELKGERIDVIDFHNDQPTYIAKALSPAKTASVTVDTPNKRAEVIVPDDQLSLAIGKAGQNVRLAAKLTGWHIDIKSQSDKKIQAQASIAAAEAAAAQAAAVTVAETAAEVSGELTRLPSVGEKLQTELIAKGFGTLEKIAAAAIVDLTQVPGIGQKKAEKIQATAKEIMVEQK